ncbi:MAG: hypothetical protein ACJ8CR_35130 [Roseiflexaceae bacterium]
MNAESRSNGSCGHAPAFAQQLQTGRVQGIINVSDEGKIDQAAAVNQGTMTYNARDENNAT